MPCFFPFFSVSCLFSVSDSFSLFCTLEELNQAAKVIEEMERCSGIDWKLTFAALEAELPRTKAGYKESPPDRLPRTPASSLRSPSGSRSGMPTPPWNHGGVLPRYPGPSDLRAPAISIFGTGKLCTLLSGAGRHGQLSSGTDLGNSPQLSLMFLHIRDDG